MNDTIHLLIDNAFDGPTNMARDEALLQLVGRCEHPPTLRFYRWNPPTISLGYFQEYADYEALPPPAGDLAVVRRQTGGGAILHDRELTYGLILPLDHPLIEKLGSPNAMYRHLHNAVADLLTAYGVPVTDGPAGGGSCSHGGPFFCFERHSCFDLLAEGRKLMGSAQRRTREAVLQHGSLIQESRFDQQQCATISQYADLVIDKYLPELAQRIAGGPVVPIENLTDEVLALAEEIRLKYAGDEWTRKR